MDFICQSATFCSYSSQNPITTSVAVQHFIDYSQLKAFSKAHCVAYKDEEDEKLPLECGRRRRSKLENEF